LWPQPLVLPLCCHVANLSLLHCVRLGRGLWARDIKTAACPRYTLPDGAEGDRNASWKNITRLWLSIGSDLARGSGLAADHPAIQTIPLPAAAAAAANDGEIPCGEPGPEPAAAMPQLSPKRRGYGLPCAKCRTYYAADQTACPVCKATERVSPCPVSSVKPVTSRHRRPSETMRRWKWNASVSCGNSSLKSTPRSHSARLETPWFDWSYTAA